MDFVVTVSMRNVLKLSELFNNGEVVKILLVQCIYNEIKLLPWKMQWAKANGLQVFTFDNGSTDGSVEWLERHQCDYAMLDTEDMFSLRRNNEAMLAKFHELKPDWCVIAGCDMFYRLLDRPELSLKKIITTADNQGYNMIDCSRLFNFYYTGNEDDNKNPLTEYRYYEEKSDWNVHLIAKYDPKLWLDADMFYLPEVKLFQYPDFVCLHYWFRSDARERFISKWRRRFQAWERGIDIQAHGRHYPGIVMEDRWVRDKGGLKEFEVG